MHGRPDPGVRDPAVGMLGWPRAGGLEGKLGLAVAVGVEVVEGVPVAFEEAAELGGAVDQERSDDEEWRHRPRAIEAVDAGFGVLGDKRGARRHERGVEHGEGGEFRFAADPVGVEIGGHHETSAMAAWTWSAVATLAFCSAAAMRVWWARRLIRRGKPWVA